MALGSVFKNHCIRYTDIFFLKKWHDIEKFCNFVG